MQLRDQRCTLVAVTSRISLFLVYSFRVDPELTYQARYLCMYFRQHPLP
jgi:hypothetical protein